MAAVKKTDEKAPANAEGPGNAEVQDAFDTATKQGFFGVEADPTPNENYTVTGVLAGKPTPETDAKAAAEAQKHAAETRRPGDGPGTE